MSDSQNHLNEPVSHPDPLTGEPGAHPVETGLGAAGAGTIGTIVGGVVGGPIGAVVGATIGAVTGGLLGKETAEVIDASVEHEYWRAHHTSRPYFEPNRTYDDYAPAYQTGYDAFSRYGQTEREFDDIEPELQHEYMNNHGKTGLAWDKVKPAAQDAYRKLSAERVSKQRSL